MSEKFKVHDKQTIFIHWFNAFCWFILVLSGFGIISGDFVRLAPAFWPETLQNIFGGNANIVLFHVVLGITWILGFVIFIIFNLKSTLIFLKRVLVLTPMAAIRDTYSMVVTLLQLFGLFKNLKVPPAHRYNGAQRLLGTMIIFSSLGIAATGLYMFFAPQILNFSESAIYGLLFRWALVMHLSLVLLVLVGLVAHIYFAVVEEPESLEAMKSGDLEVDFIKHHNPLWYEELKQQGRL